MPAVDWSSGPGRLAEILATLGQAGVRYPEPLEPASLPARFSAAGFRLDEDTMRSFTRSVTAAEAELVVRSFYVPRARPRS